MADKISTVVLKVDLECDRCYKKIRKVICKIQDKANIKTISYDEKSNAVMVSGPFDAEKVCRKLCCEAGRVIKDMHIKGKEKEAAPRKDKDGGDKEKAAKPAEKKDAGKPEKKDAGGGKPEKADKAAAKVEKSDKPKDAKPKKKVKFELVDAPAPAPAADAKPGKVMPAGMSKADLAPLLEKMMAGKQGHLGPAPPCGEPIAPPPAAAQGVAVPSIWPAPAGSVPCYSYTPGFDQPSSYYGGCGGGWCGRCGACTAKPAQAGGYYGGAPAYDHQGWYYGNRHPYYHHQQQPYYEDPNGACSVM